MNSTLTRTVRYFIPDVPAIRPLFAATLINNIGSGVAISALPLYLTRVVGLSPVQVGIAFGCAAIAGMVMAIPTGMLADKVGPRLLLIVSIASMGMAVLAYQLVSSFISVLIVSTLYGAFDRGVATVAATVVARAVDGERRVEVRASLRVALNVGLTSGGALSAILLAFDSNAAYRLGLLFDALTFFAAALCYLALRQSGSTPTGNMPTPRLAALRDPRYVSTVTLLSALQISASILSLAIPLWVADSTPVPVAFVSVVVVFNTVGIFMGQTPVARRVRTVAGAARAARLGGVAFLLCTVAFGAAGLVRGVGPAIALLFVGTIFLVAGELLSSTAQFNLGYELANEAIQGQYQGVFSTIMGAVTSIGPALVAFLALQVGPPGWLALGLFFMVAGALVPPATRLRNRMPLPQRARPETSNERSDSGSL